MKTSAGIWALSALFGLSASLALVLCFPKISPDTLQTANDAPFVSIIDENNQIRYEQIKMYDAAPLFLSTSLNNKISPVKERFDFEIPLDDKSLKLDYKGAVISRPKSDKTSEKSAMYSGAQQLFSVFANNAEKEGSPADTPVSFEIFDLANGKSLQKKYMKINNNKRLFAPIEAFVVVDEFGQTEISAISGGTANSELDAEIQKSLNNISGTESLEKGTYKIIVSP